MAEHAKARHNKSAKEPETASTDSSGSLTENFQKAAKILISLVQLYYDDAEATFGDDNSNLSSQMMFLEGYVLQLIVGVYLSKHFGNQLT